ncbi:MAG: M3 family oligoendopeptidase [Flavobacteriales bacterium]
MLLEKTKREFLPTDFDITKWETLEPVYLDLKEREFASFDEFKTWLSHWNELESALEEEYAWSYIRMTIDTSNEAHSKRYNHLVTQISPKISPLTNELNKKLNESEFKDELKGKEFEIWFKNVKNAIDLFREENIKINSEISVYTQKYGALTGGMQVELNGEKLTMPQAGKLLQRANREERQAAYEAITSVRLKAKDEVNSIFNELLVKRNQVALNSDFKDFRDYKFKSLGRFDFTKEDCFSFHQSIASEVTPLVNEFYRTKQKDLNINPLKPWDTSAPKAGNEPLKPFSNAEELTEKSISVFSKIDSYFGQALSDMKELGHLDLASKQGKSPGGYNYPLYESGAPFIFMNSVGTPRDLVTMMHEGGHAVHSFLTHKLPYAVFKSCPSEVAELASMSMELISMDHWDEFYATEEELKRAKRDHLEDSISALPWIAMVDKFQHWIYENPTHSNEEREEQWLAINQWLGNDVVDWNGQEEAQRNTWQKQLHIFELPFYYIEYGMAQLGAIAMWKNYREDPVKTIAQYKAALELGYTKSVPQIYETAGIKFDFSPDYIRSLMEFMKEELGKI